MDKITEATMSINISTSFTFIAYSTHSYNIVYVMMEANNETVNALFKLHDSVVLTFFVLDSFTRNGMRSPKRNAVHLFSVGLLRVNPFSLHSHFANMKPCKLLEIITVPLLSRIFFRNLIAYDLWISSQIVYIYQKSSTIHLNVEQQHCAKWFEA